jgi:hypothetical protein
VACPCMSIVVFLSFNRSPCPLTILENKYRRELGLTEIRGFIGNYFLGVRNGHGPNRG